MLLMIGDECVTRDQCPQQVFEEIGAETRFDAAHRRYLCQPVFTLLRGGDATQGEQVEFVEQP